MPEEKKERIYLDREEAGRLLGEALVGRVAAEPAKQGWIGPDPVVLALPRGGVPVAYGVARALGAPLEVFVVRKIGAPMHPELGMGAITEGGTAVLDDAIVRLAGATREQVQRVTERERAEVARRVARYRSGRPLPDLRGRAVVLVDDGIATGGTARAALRDLRQRGPARLVLAAPVCAQDTVAALRAEADEVFCLDTPAWFHAVGEWYADFRQLDDDEVVAWLERARADRGLPAEAALRDRGEEWAVTAAGAILPGVLTLPAGARAVVVFAHAGAPGRRSPRSRYLAEILHKARYGTLLLDLLTDGETVGDAVTGRLRFDVPLLARRLVAVIDALGGKIDPSLAVGLFGAGTGTAAALVAASERPAAVRVVISRGGRPDLARDVLPRVQAAVLLIVGGRDPAVIELNREALRGLPRGSMVIVRGATHLFEEAGALDEVGQLAVKWLDEKLEPVPA